MRELCRVLLQWAAAVAAAAAAKELAAAAEERASIRQHTSAHELAHVSTRQHTSAANEQDFTSAKVQILTPANYKSCAKASSTELGPATEGGVLLQVSVFVLLHQKSKVALVQKYKY
jgi:hypothetical protein